VNDLAAELPALARETERRAIARLGDAHRLGGNCHAGAVHQRHDVSDQPALAPADQQCGGVFEHQFARRRAVNAELVFDAPHHHLRAFLDEEQAQPSGVLGALFRAGEHQKDVAATVSDEPLDAVEQPLLRLIGGRRLQLDRLQVRSCIGLGERHSARGFACRNARQNSILDLITSEAVKRLGYLTQTEQVHERGIGAADYLRGHHVYRVGNVQPAVFTGKREAHHLGLAEQIERFGDAGGIGNLAVLEFRSVNINLLGTWSDEVTRYLAHHFEHATIVIPGVIIIDRCRGIGGGIAVVVFDQPHEFAHVHAVEMELDVIVVVEEVRHSGLTLSIYTPRSSSV